MKTNINNKKAYHDYEILEKEVAGIKLVGTEMKSLRKGKASIKEAYVYLDEKKNCAIIKGMYIAEDETNHNTHKETRERILLLTKKQVKRWIKETQSGGTTIVPLKAFFNKENLFKIEIGLAKGKKLFDKKNKIKEDDAKKEVQRALKRRY